MSTEEWTAAVEAVFAERWPIKVPEGLVPGGLPDANGNYSYWHKDMAGWKPSPVPATLREMVEGR